MGSSPLISRSDPAAYARVNGQNLTARQFAADILACAQHLPDGDYTINLCSNRYLYSVAFFAALVRGQTNLLPSRRTDATIAALADTYARSNVLTDSLTAPDGFHLVNINPGDNGDANSPLIDDHHIAAIAFTSGSTGAPVAHTKSWGMLCDWRAIHARYLPGDPDIPRGLVATVPSWHMYGLEWALMLPTVAPLTLHCGADFFPHDVLAALRGFDEATVLVSTPVHLRAIERTLADRAPAPGAVEVTLSATAPLDKALSERIERHLGTHIFEIYGCSEIGSLAWRYPSEQRHWAFFDAFAVHYSNGAVTITHAHVPQGIELADQFARVAHGTADRFELLGRSADIVKVGGQRESLAHLNLLLLGIPGVEDGVFYRPEDHGLPATGRLGALVVAPDLTLEALRAQLTTCLIEHSNAVFAPRPLRKLASLPREGTSKLSRDALGRVIRDLAEPDAHESPVQ